MRGEPQAWYHRKYPRVTGIEDCYTEDIVCRSEHNSSRSVLTVSSLLQGGGQPPVQEGLAGRGRDPSHSEGEDERLFLLRKGNWSCPLAGLYRKHVDNLKGHLQYILFPGLPYALSRSQGGLKPRLQAHLRRLPERRRELLHQVRRDQPLLRTGGGRLGQAETPGHVGEKARTHRIRHEGGGQRGLSQRNNIYHHQVKTNCSRNNS